MTETRAEAKYEVFYDDSFSYFLIVSVAVHAAIAVIFGVKMAFFPSKDIIIKSAVRVDMVALPDKVAPKVAKPKPKPKPTPAPQPKPKPKPDTPKPDLKSAQNSAMERLKALQAIENIKNEVKETEKEVEEEKAQEFKGNIVTSGSALKGLDKLHFDEYFGKLEKHVKNNWVLPQWLVDKGLRTQLLVKIDERGFVVGKEVVTSSGNNIFDNMALEAIEKSSPCPIPPDRLQDMFVRQGVVFNFP